MNSANNLVFAGIHNLSAGQDLPVSYDEAMRILHGQFDDGRIIKGLDVTYHAWSLVGKRRWVAVLRWPLIRHLFDLGYRFFARYRQPISRLFGRKLTCNIDDKT
jgi:predicted DCC family thiol-disulfide oxidoreductase YuxK